MSRFPRIWEARLVATPTIAALEELRPDYETMLVTILDAILRRHERDPGYPFVDTKLNLVTGADFAPCGDAEKDFVGKSAIFGWIQGRGLEALAGHAEWLARSSFLKPDARNELIFRIRRMVRTVFTQMEMLRVKNGGRIGFVMTPEGRRFARSADGRRCYATLAEKTGTLTDLFYVKGMLAASRLLGATDKSGEGRRLFRSLIANIEDDQLRNDQISFDPKNVVVPDPGKRGHAGRMIALFGLASLVEAGAEVEWIEAGRRFIRATLALHMNHGQWPELEPFDFTEWIDSEGEPWRTAGAVLCDPGHALEFVGAAAKFLLSVRASAATSETAQFLAECRDSLPPLFLRAFRAGRNPDVAGIYKTVDLETRRPWNNDMPWWNLPETMRAGVELLALWPDLLDRDALLEAVGYCSNGFVTNFVNRGCHLMAYQTLSAEGRPVPVIPATPDADPAYHTGLSLIDFLSCLERAVKTDRKPEPWREPGRSPEHSMSS